MAFSQADRGKLLQNQFSRLETLLKTPPYNTPKGLKILQLLLEDKISPHKISEEYLELYNDIHHKDNEISRVTRGAISLSIINTNGEFKHNLKLGDEQISALTSLLEERYDLTIDWPTQKDLPDNLKKITTLVERNRFLRGLQLPDIAEEACAASDRDTINLTSEALDKLQKALNFLREDEKANVVAIQKLVNLQDEVMWKRINWLLRHVKIAPLEKVAVEISKSSEAKIELTEAVNLCLKISPLSPHYEKAHFRAFQTRYIEYLAEHKDLSKITAKMIRSAFLGALPACLNQEEKLILFRDKDDQKIVDRIAFAAGGRSDIEQISDEIVDKLRLPLLQFLLLLKVKEKVESSKKVTGTSTDIFSSTDDPLKILKNILEKFPEKFDSVAQKAVQDFWSKAMDQLALLPKNLFTDNLRILLQAVAKLTTEKTEQPRLV